MGNSPEPPTPTAFHSRPPVASLSGASRSNDQDRKCVFSTQNRTPGRKKATRDGQRTSLGEEKIAVTCTRFPDYNESQSNPTVAFARRTWKNAFAKSLDHCDPKTLKGQSQLCSTQAPLGTPWHPWAPLGNPWEPLRTPGHTSPPPLPCIYLLFNPTLSDRRCINNVLMFLSFVFIVRFR